MFLKKPFRLCLFEQDILVKYYYNLKQLFTILIHFKMYFTPVMMVELNLINFLEFFDDQKNSFYLKPKSFVAF